MTLAVTLVACGTTPAPNYGGRWQPMDRLAPEATPILLQRHYVYYVAPVDNTLKGVLERWARDSGVPLDYSAAHDFTLHSVSGHVRADDLGTAVRMMQTAYQSYGLSIRFESGRIAVQAVADASVPQEAP